MKTIKGDLIKLAKDGEFDAIIHQCNCFCTMNSGIAKAIRENFPAAYVADKATISGDKDKLGTLSVVMVHVADNKSLWIVNAYGQHRYGRDKRHTDYDALRSCFKLVKEEFSGMKMGLPLIGCGTGGGTWDVVEKIIQEELGDEDITLVVLEEI